MLDPTHPAHKFRHTTTNSGVNIYSPDQFKVCEFRISDMMDGISKLCRYNGQINEFYSVAEHSVLVSMFAEAEGDVDAIAPALFHDAHEYISGDFPTPHKRMVRGLEAFEEGYERVVREALGMPGQDEPVWTRVAWYDSIILHRELIVLRRDNLPKWFDPDMQGRVPSWIQPVGHDWREARAMFRQRMHWLGYGLGGNI